jgi:hypothetical protein
VERTSAQSLYRRFFGACSRPSMTSPSGGPKEGLLLSSGYMTWSFVVFPLWVLLVSCNILIDNLRRLSS